MSTKNSNSPASGVDVPRLVSNYFADDGAPLQCPKCECRYIREKIVGVVDVVHGQGPTCEAEYFCQECGEPVGFWAYGSWHPEYRDSFIANEKGDS